MDEILYRRAKARVEERLGFYRHATIYVAVNLFLLGLNWVKSPGHWWAIWSVLGWGIGLASHGIHVFRGAQEPTAKTQKPNMNQQSSKPVLVCAFGILAAFFMPWIQLFGIGVSGYNLGQLGSYGNYAWIIPILAGATILLSFSGVSNRGIGACAGIVPLGALLYALIRLGSEGGAHATEGVLKIAGQVFSIGIYLTIIFSIAIIIAALAPTVAESMAFTSSPIAGAASRKEGMIRREMEREARERASRQAQP